MHGQTGKRMFKVMVPIEKKDGGTFWMRIGTGFPGKDPASMNLFIDAYPVNQKMLHVREMEEEDFQRNERRGDRRIGEPAPGASAGDVPF